MSLRRNQVLQTCVNNESDRCGYLVFFHFQRLPLSEPDAGTLAKSLQNKLPSQLVSLLMAATSQIERCPADELVTFVDSVIVASKRSVDRKYLLVDFSPNISMCFRRGIAELSISLIASGGKIPGFILCKPNYKGIDSCDIMFSRVNVEPGAHDAVDERMEISSFRRSEVVDMLSNFPKFPLTGNNELQNDFLSALSWIGETLSSKPRQIRSGE